MLPGRGNFLADVSVLSSIQLDEAVMPELSAHWLIRWQRSSTTIVGSYQVRSIMTAQAPVYAFNREEAQVQDGEVFAVIWRNAQRIRSELLGIWFSRLGGLWPLSHAGWFKLGTPRLPPAERGESTQAG